MWLAERFGWTLSYIDALPTDDAFEVIDIVNSNDLARAHNRKYHK